jgi:acyl carrier protein
MTDDEITRRVVELVARQAEGVAPDLIRADTGFDTLGFDSIRQLRLVAATENQLGVELSAGALATVRTIGDLVQVVAAAQPTQPA